MSEVDPLIKREMQWMALGVYENRDLAPIIIAKVRRQRIRRAVISTFAVVAIAGASIGIYELAKPGGATVVTSEGAGVTGSNSLNQPEIIGLQSDYPVTWEQSIGDLGAGCPVGGVGSCTYCVGGGELRILVLDRAPARRHGVVSQVHRNRLGEPVLILESGCSPDVEAERCRAHRGAIHHVSDYLPA